MRAFSRWLTSSRESIVGLAAPGAIGAELGVATGQFSRRLLETGAFGRLFSIDAWNDGSHNAHEYREACELLAPFGDSSVVIRSRFNDIVDSFADGFFDFIYVDGYAHTGQDNGETLSDWWHKLTPGGVFAGDDYSPNWPKTIEAVNAFVSDRGLNLNVYDFERDPRNPWDQSPGWFVIKPNP